MGRSLRIHQPGAAFHVFARTQGHVSSFTDDIKSDIARALVQGTASTGARPCAFAVMDNHFHLVLFQGQTRLGWTMQPVMRKIAWIVRRKHGLKGHIFENRYRAKLCADSEYLPTAIAYVHNNPVAAGCCKSATQYIWSSARAYEGIESNVFLAVEDGLRAFYDSAFSDIRELREAYVARLRKKASSEIDGYWNWLTHELRVRSKRRLDLPVAEHRMRRALADLRDTAIRIHAALRCTIAMDEIRSRFGGREVVAARRAIILGLIQREYRHVDIAKFMRVSNATVSQVSKQLRAANLESIVEAANNKK